MFFTWFWQFFFKPTEEAPVEGAQESNYSWYGAHTISFFSLGLFSRAVDLYLQITTNDRNVTLYIWMRILSLCWSVMADQKRFSASDWRCKTCEMRPNAVSFVFVQKLRFSSLALLVQQTICFCAQIFMIVFIVKRHEIARRHCSV